jgi:tetratricopeptide (TPR) repeat protein
MTRRAPQERIGAVSVIQRLWLKNWFKALLLFAMILAAYRPALQGGFVWDDDKHIYDNQTLRSLHGLWEIWFKPGATCQYYPLSFTGFWIGFQFWGLNPFGYHLLNVVLHSLVAVLLWQVLTRLKARGAWLAGAIFALHPVCVMSVAWMTELKNTLSASLALGAAWAYLRFAGLGVYERLEPGSKIGRVTPGAPVSASPATAGAWCRALSKEAPARWCFYAWSLVLFQLGFFAKTAISFLPVSLLLVTWWRRERLRWRDIWPLIPMLGCVVVMGGVTIYVERHSLGASGRKFTIPLIERILISGRSFWFYLGKLFFPHRLTFIYERWKIDAGAGWQYVYPLATAGLLAGLWGMRGRMGKGPFVALLHFYVCTSLLILLLVLYMTRYSFVSDHWQYFGCMSVVALAAAGITAMLDRLKKRRLFLEPAFCGALVAGLGMLTWRQAGIYLNPEKLWRDTLAKNPDCWLAHNNLGLLLENQGRMEEAMEHCQKAVQINPDYYESLNNLGAVLAARGRFDEAIENYSKAIQINPNSADTLKNLGNAFAIKGRFAEAIKNYRKAIQINPNHREALNNLALLLATSPAAEFRDGAEAIRLAERACKLTHYGDPWFISTLAAAYAEAGRFPEAVTTAEMAEQLATTSGFETLAGKNRRLLELYRAGKPYHEPAPTRNESR